MIYRRSAREPINCLAFLVPLVVICEAGIWLTEPESGSQKLVAQSVLRQFAAWFGTDAVWIPGAALLATLLIWQSWGKRSWRLGWRTPLLMAVESVLLAVPLLVLGRLLQQGGDSGSAIGLPRLAAMAIGAGVYEELLFRFYLVGGLTLAIRYLFGILPAQAALAAAVLSSLAFAGCHFQPVGAEPFAWLGFTILTGAGLYLAIIFIGRGLGVATGCHVAYNVISVFAAYHATA